MRSRRSDIGHPTYSPNDLHHPLLPFLVTILFSLLFTPHSFPKTCSLSLLRYILSRFDNIRSLTSRFDQNEIDSSKCSTSTQKVLRT